MEIVISVLIMGFACLVVLMGWLWALIKEEIENEEEDKNKRC